MLQPSTVLRNRCGSWLSHTESYVTTRFTTATVPRSNMLVCACLDCAVLCFQFSPEIAARRCAVEPNGGGDKPMPRPSLSSSHLCRRRYDWTIRALHRLGGAHNGTIQPDLVFKERRPIDFEREENMIQMSTSTPLPCCLHGLKWRAVSGCGHLPCSLLPSTSTSLYSHMYGHAHQLTFVRRLQKLCGIKHEVIVGGFYFFHIALTLQVFLG